MNSGNVKPTERLVKEVIDRLGSELVEELQELRTEVQSLRSNKTSEIQRLTDRLVKLWTKPLPNSKAKLFFDDPVWGHTVVDESMALLFKHPLVQRLNYVRQLSFAYLAFPSATHTRLSHSLGTCRLIETALSTVFRNDVIYTETGRERIDLTSTERQRLISKAKTVALLHDLGHPPFGHALDRLIGFHDPAHPIPSPDKHYSVDYLGRFLSDVIPDGLVVEELRAILTHDAERLSGWETFISDLVDSSLDVDRMDFLARDAHMSGLLMGFNSSEALIERICPYRMDDQVYLTFDESCLPYVNDLLFAREKMYLNCYEHPKKLAAERIFTRLVQSLIEDHQIDKDQTILLSDDQAMALLGLASLGSEENSALLDALLQNANYELVYWIGLADAGEGTEVGSWKKLRDRTGMGRAAYVERPRQWEKDIATSAGLDIRPWHVLAVVPDHKTGEPPGLNARMLLSGSSGFKATKISPSLLSKLKDEQKPRSRIRVFADSRLSEEQRNAVIRAARDALG